MKQSIVFFLLLITLLNSCGNIPPEFDWPDEKNQNRNDSSKTDGKLQFRFIDVGQGDATLITTPNGKQILIDAGTPEMGSERVLPLLGSGMELIIASHYDTDHIGGIAEVIKGPDGIIDTPDDILPLRGVLDRGASPAVDSTSLSNYSIATSGLRFSLKAGENFTIDDVDFLILAQNGEFSNGTRIDIDPDHENAHSIALLITYNDVSYLTSGDIPGPNFPNKYEPHDLEQYLPDIVGEIDILHVSHHGSHNSTNQEFVEAIKPNTAIISVGENDYGHPHETVIENLRSVGTDIYQTNGDICIQTDGYTLVPDTC
jgi:competence protein ComEC